MARQIPAKDPVTGKFVKSDIKSETTEDVNYDEIKDKTFNEVATEAPETPEETPKEELKGETIKVEPKTEEIEFDPKKFKEEVAAEVSAKVSQETADKISQSLTGKGKASETQKDKYEAYAEKFNAEKGRLPTWFEIAAFIKEEVKAEQIADQQQQAKQQEEQTKQQQEVEKQRSLAFNKYLDEQLEDLFKSGRLDRNNTEQRKALFQSMLTVNQERVKQGLQPIYSIKEIFYEHYKVPNSQPAGADAPVSAGMRSTGHAEDDSKDYSYADIKKKSFMDMLLGK